jgi:hypothetical protein
MNEQELRQALKERSTGRWGWDKIDCCFTGKDADLEPWGQQGVELQKVVDGVAYCVAHILAVVAGNEVCLNLPVGISEEDEEKALGVYMDQAQEIVVGCGLGGEWDGDDWVLSEAIYFSVDLEGAEDPVAAICDRADVCLQPYETDLVFMNQLLDELAGWKERADDDDGWINCEAGKPGPCSVWSLHNAD